MQSLNAMMCFFFILSLACGRDSTRQGDAKALPRATLFESYPHPHIYRNASYVAVRELTWIEITLLSSGLQ
jgi:hypothetical protein